MAPFGRVLVGIGGSERHCDALALAQRLVDLDDGELILAHVDGDRSIRHLRPRAGAYAAELLAAARADVHGAIAVRETSRSAPSVARGLTELAEEAGTDLLVVGSGRPDTPGHVAPGRIGMRLVSGAPCAVALAPAGARDAGAFRHVGIAYDGSPEAAAALASGYALAARDRAAVSIFYAIPAGGLAWTGPQPDEMERSWHAERLRAQELLDDAADAAPGGVNPRTVLLYGDPVRRITAACDGIVDIVFAGSRGYGPLHRALAGSVSEALLLPATQPFIVMPRSGAVRRGGGTRRERGRTMTRLLIAFDGSDRAAEAVLAAGRLFPGAEAIVLSVAHDPWDLEPAPVTTLTLAGRAIPPARRSGTSTARGIAQRGCDLAQDAGLDAEPVSLAGGRPAVQICRAARRHEVDAIVCGTHGHSSPRRGIAGSTAIAVMHHAGQPVLVVPPGAPAGSGTVVVAYDGSDPSRAAVRTAGRLFAGRPGVAVHAGDDSAIASEGAALARENGLRCTSETVEPADAAEAVLAAARSADASAVIAGSRGRGAVASTLLGSFSRSLLHEASLPVLIAKAA